MNSRFSPFKVLVVEDDYHQQGLFCSLFGSEYTLDFVQGPEDLLKQLTGEDIPELVIMNEKNLNETGLSLVGELQEHRDFPPVAVIFITKSFSRKDKIRALEVGALDIIDIFDNHEKIKAKISALLGFIRQVKGYSRKTLGRELLSAMAVPPRLPLGEQKSLEERIEESTKLSSIYKKLLILLLQGFEYKEISVELGMNYEACKKMIQRFYQNHRIQGKISLIKNLDHLI